MAESANDQRSLVSGSVLAFPPSALELARLGASGENDLSPRARGPLQIFSKTVAAC